MAELDFLLQAVTSSNHAKALRALLGIPRPTEVLISVAFVRESGLDTVAAVLKPLAKKVKFFIGIRNDITSIQAIKRLLAMNVELYAVDTGSRNTIFHPKLYFAAGADHATTIIGSANLTFSGLHNNIEVSTIMKLDLSDPADKKFVDMVINAFSEMRSRHPQHVFLIKNKNHANKLFESGLLADENVIPAPSSSRSVKKGERDTLPPMKLNRTNRPPVKKNMAAKARITAKRVAPIAAKYLVWKSKYLTERDLNIPTGKNTHATGSMGLKKGVFESIDQRHYFREEVFADLEWIVDARRPIWERAETKVELVIKTLNYGLFNLKLSHNSDNTSRSYQQNNFMTQIHWGEAKQHIAKPDLLGRILYLYRKDTTPPEFMIEID